MSVFKYVGTKWTRVLPEGVQSGEYYEVYSYSGEYSSCGVLDDFVYTKVGDGWHLTEFDEDGKVSWSGKADYPGRVSDDAREYFDGTILLVSADELKFLHRIVR